MCRACRPPKRPTLRLPLFQLRETVPFRELEEALHISDDVLYRAQRCQGDLGVDQIIDISEYLNDDRLIDAICRARGGRFVRDDETAAELDVPALMRRQLEIGHEDGLQDQQVLDAVADGHLSDSELQALDTGYARQEAQLARIRADIRCEVDRRRAPAPSKPTRRASK